MKGPPIPQSTFRAIAVPTEHGGWGFTLEPVLLGVLVAPGWPALGLAVAAFATFLARRPLRLAVADLRRDRRLARTRMAVRLLIGSTLLALAGLLLAVAFAVAPFWWPLVIAAPLVVVQLRFDLDSRGRELAPELLGPFVLAAAAPMILAAGGLTWTIAAGAWLVLAARIIPSVLLVRTQLRRAKEQPFSTASTTGAGIAAVVAVGGAAANGWVPWLSVAAAALVVGWNWVSIKRPPVPAKTIGWTQMAVGLTVVLAFATGYHVDL